MRRFAALTLLLFVLPLVADDKPADKKPSDKEPSKETSKPAPPAPQYQAINRVSGKVTEIDTKEMKITIEMQVRTSVKSYTTKAVKEEINIVDDVKVRAMKLPERFDDNNKPKPYTDAEKAKLKGNDPKLPGFASDLSKVAVGQFVQIDMGVRKPPPGAPKKKDKDVEPEKPAAIMIFFTVEEAKPEKPEKKSK